MSIIKTAKSTPKQSFWTLPAHWEQYAYIQYSILHERTYMDSAPFHNVNIFLADNSCVDRSTDLKIVMNPFHDAELICTPFYSFSIHRDAPAVVHYFLYEGKSSFIVTYSSIFHIQVLIGRQFWRWIISVVAENAGDY